MKVSFGFTFAATLLLADRTKGFAPLSVGVTRTGALFAVKLTPEPEGGEVLTAVKTMDGSKMKNMGVAEGIKNKDGTVYKFWLSAVAQGALVKELNTEVLKDAKKKANFPGFRKGQIPPYAMPQIRGFAVQEGIVQTVQSAIDAYGLKTISGKDGEMEVQEDVAEIASGYKVGDDIQFTATFKAILDPELVSATESDAIDVEAEST